MTCSQRSVALLAFCLVATPVCAGSLNYFRIGNKNNIQTVPTPGTAMMGGGKDLDEAFHWLCRKSNGGDFLILRASGDDAYNSYVNGLCKLNSVATLIIPDRQTAQDPAVAAIVRKAAAVFISGGDQARYIRAWEGTAVADAMNEDVRAGKPVGGTSAGLAILGEFIYGALADSPDSNNLSSSDVLSDPYSERATLVHGFLHIPNLRNVLTDSHFAKRDRMGRCLGFLARITQDESSGFPRGVAIDEKSALLVEADGNGTVIGSGRGAYFIRPTRKPDLCERGEPLTFENVSVYRVAAGGHFDLRTWSGNDGTAYVLSVKSGKLDSTQANQAAY